MQGLHEGSMIHVTAAEGTEFPVGVLDPSLRIEELEVRRERAEVFQMGMHQVPFVAIIENERQPRSSAQLGADEETGEWRRRGR